MIEKHYLLPIEELKSLYPALELDRDMGHYRATVRIDGKGKSWNINRDMKKKFGDGREYTFEVIGNPSYNNYTHKCKEDNFFYHSSWFCSEFPEGPKDPSQPEPSLDPVQVDIKDLEIPEG